jgi:hypothetical protein
VLADAVGCDVDCPIETEGFSEAGNRLFYRFGVLIVCAVMVEKVAGHFLKRHLFFCWSDELPRADLAQALFLKTLSHTVLVAMRTFPVTLAAMPILNPVD